MPCMFFDHHVLLAPNRYFGYGNRLSNVSKIINSTSFDTDSNKVIDHLSASLRKLRRNNLAVDPQNGNYSANKIQK